MLPGRLLIVNADDLGLSAAVNAGVFEAHERGIVTSASLMVWQGAAVAAVEEAARHPEMAIGLHLDLLGRDYETGRCVRPSLPAGGAKDERSGELAPLEEECRAQLERFRALVGRDPTHLDSHRHMHETEPLAAVAERLATELGVPLRNRAIPYEGSFFGRGPAGESLPEAISAEQLVELIRSLPEGWTEIGCHPAAGPVPNSSYDAERQLELRALCDPRVREALNVTGVKLCSFAQAAGR